MYPLQLGVPAPLPLQQTSSAPPDCPATSFPLTLCLSLLPLPLCHSLHFVSPASYSLTTCFPPTHLPALPHPQQVYPLQLGVSAPLPPQQTPSAPPDCPLPQLGTLCGRDAIGAIVGIILGGLLVMGLIALLFYFLVVRVGCSYEVWGPRGLQGGSTEVFKVSVVL